MIMQQFTGKNPFESEQKSCISGFFVFNVMDSFMHVHDWYIPVDHGVL